MNLWPTLQPFIWSTHHRIAFFYSLWSMGKARYGLLPFHKAILEGKPIQVFNQGDLYRDFTYIDDIVEGIINVLNGTPDQQPPYKVYNIGNSSPVKLMDFIETIEKALGKEAT
jgi:UDP-glucuronate 4-epimerase